MRFVFQKQSRTVVHEVNLCAKRVQCSERTTTERVLQLGNLPSVPKGTLRGGNHPRSGWAPPLHSAPGGCVPFGTLVASSPFPVFRRYVPFGTLCKATSRGGPAFYRVPTSTPYLCQN